MKKLFFLFTFLPLFFSCENENVQELEKNNTNVTGRSSCLSVQNQSIAIWYYPVSGHAMRCEVWCERNNPSSTAIRLKSKTTHYEWKDGQFRIRNTSAVFAKISVSNSLQLGGGYMDHSNNNNNWYVATTNWVDLFPVYPHIGTCFTSESTHKIKVNGIWYERIINLNDHW